MRWFKNILYVLLGIVGLITVIMLLYMVMGSSEYKGILSKYNTVGQVKQRGSGDGNKKLNFLTSYYSETGDLTLATAVKKNKGEDNMSQSGGSSDSSDENNSIVDSVDGSDFREIAKAVAGEFKINGSYTYGTPNKDNAGYFYNYSQNNGSKSAFLMLDGSSIKTTHRDCSCFVSMMLCQTKLKQKWVHYTSGTIANCGACVTNSINTIGDLKAGDILWRKSHVAMVVYNDGNLVYVGDFGSATTSNYSSGTVGSNGDKTAEQGYAYTINCSKPFAQNGKNFTEVYRPQ